MCAIRERGPWPGPARCVRPRDGTQNLAGLYPLFGLIERQDKSRMTSRLIAFSPHEVFQACPTARCRTATVSACSPPPKSLLHADGAGAGAWTEATSAGLRTRVSTEPAEAALRSLMVEHAVIIHGAVRQPGSYPVDGQVRLETLLTTAGGLTAQADANAIEITSPEDQSDPGTLANARRVVSLRAANGMTTEIGSGEAVRVNPVFKTGRLTRF